MSTGSAAEKACRVGRVTESLRLAEQSSVESPALLAELLYLSGDIARAKAVAGLSFAKLPKEPPTSAERSRISVVLAACHADEGNFKTALSFGRQALALAQESRQDQLVAIAAAALLERSCDDEGFDTSLPLASLARRSAARSSDPHAHAAVHSTFGRLEGRLGRLDTALRHLNVARTLLEREPQLVLSASIDLDISSVLALSGNTDAAMESARHAAATAAESGWLRGQVVAAVNLAQFLVSALRFDEATQQIERARSIGLTHVGQAIALIDTEAQIALTQGLLEKAELLLDEGRSLAAAAPRWYALSLEKTRNRLLIASQRFQEAERNSAICIESAKEVRTRQLVESFALQRIEARIECGQVDGLVEGLTRDDSTEQSVALTGARHLALGKCFGKYRQNQRALQHLNRAQRILGLTGDRATESDARAALQKLMSDPQAATSDLQRPETDESRTPSHSLDTAVALLDLAGHPHILARETFALLQEADCADALALVAAGGHATRLIAAHGWSDADALQAARRASPDDLITFGPHRDETWQILARPRPSLDHRCTLAAIRKLVAIARTLDHYRRDEKQRAALWPAEALDGDAESLWISEQSADLLAIARRIANAPLPVLLTGETGTGKEMLARVIHRASARADRPLHPFNCTAVPREMLESQLFGHRKGAFTGADTGFQGVIRAAAGGTLFLDEIGDVSLDLQPKLLRFLEHGEIHPLGDPHPITVDVRIIAATNANLELLVAQGRFREDLFYRLNVMKLHLPPLRERREEIPPLLQHYIRRFADQQRKGAPTLSDDTLEYLLLYAWPGNVRQLANEVRRMIALAEPDATLTPALLSPEILASRRTIPAAPAPAEPEISLRLDQPLPDAVETLEQSLIRRALERSHGRVEEAARLLGISRKGLFLKRRRWGFETAERGLRPADRR